MKEPPKDRHWRRQTPDGIAWCNLRSDGYTTVGITGDDGSHRQLGLSCPERKIIYEMLGVAVKVRKRKRKVKR